MRYLPPKKHESECQGCSFKLNGLSKAFISSGSTERRRIKQDIYVGGSILAAETALYPPWEDSRKQVQRSVTSECLSRWPTHDSSCHSQPPGPLQALTFVLNTKSIVLSTRNWVAVNSHVHSSGDWLFTTPFATHGRPETDRGGAWVRRTSLG